MSKFAVIAVIGLLFMSALGAAAVEWSIGFANSMRAFISVALLTASLFVVLSKRYLEKDRNWAYGTIGALIGFWLHT
jgi:hypothetical protein